MSWSLPFVDDPGEVVVGIETDRGSVGSRVGRDRLSGVRHQPLSVARYRDRHNVAGAKSDAGDAKVFADLVRTDRHNHRPIAGDSPAAEAIKVLARGHQNLIWAEPPASCIIKPCGRSATVSSASSTAASKTEPSTTNTPPGRTANRKNNTMLLDD